MTNRIKNFALFEADIPNDHFTAEVKSDIIDINGKDAYTVDPVSAVVRWNEELDYSKGGIENIGAIVYDVVIDADVRWTEDADEQRETFKFSGNEIEVEVLDNLKSMFVEGLSVNLVDRKVKITFGR